MVAIAPVCVRRVRWRRDAKGALRAAEGRRDYQSDRDWRLGISANRRQRGHAEAERGAKVAQYRRTGSLFILEGLLRSGWW